MEKCHDGKKKKKKRKNKKSCSYSGGITQIIQFTHSSAHEHAIPRTGTGLCTCVNRGRIVLFARSELCFNSETEWDSHGCDSHWIWASNLNMPACHQASCLYFIFGFSFVSASFLCFRHIFCEVAQPAELESFIKDRKVHYLVLRERRKHCLIFGSHPNCLWHL